MDFEQKIEDRSRETTSDSKPCRPPGVRVSRLDTLAHVRREAGRIYRQARRFEGRDIDALTALRLSMILGTVRQSIEMEELERRVQALEKRESMSVPEPSNFDLAERLSERLLGHS
jgi:hypothetical protein